MTAQNIRRKTRQPMTVDPNNPRAMGVCDGCGFWIPWHTMKKHMQYRGGSVPVWDGFLVCDTCYDVPNEAPQFRRQVLPPDPVPIQNPRVEGGTVNSGFGYWVTESGDYVNTLETNGYTWGGDFVQTIPDPTPDQHLAGP